MPFRQSEFPLFLGAADESGDRKSAAIPSTVPSPDSAALAVVAHCDAVHNAIRTLLELAVEAAFEQRLAKAENKFLARFESGIEDCAAGLGRLEIVGGDADFGLLRRNAERALSSFGDLVRGAVADAIFPETDDDTLHAVVLRFKDSAVNAATGIGRLRHAANRYVSNGNPT